LSSVVVEFEEFDEEESPPPPQPTTRRHTEIAISVSFLFCIGMISSFL
jgi:hypothetical protein